MALSLTRTLSLWSKLNHFHPIYIPTQGEWERESRDQETFFFFNVIIKLYTISFTHALLTTFSLMPTKRYKRAWKWVFGHYGQLKPCRFYCQKDKGEDSDSQLLIWTLTFSKKPFLTPKAYPFFSALFSSVHFRSSVMSDSLRLHGLQHAKLPCPSPTPRACSNSMSIESVMPSSHLILCWPLLLPLIFPSIRIFSNELVLRTGGQSMGDSAAPMTPCN